MPWTDVGLRQCNPGLNTTLFGSARVNEQFAVLVVGQPGTSRIYRGMIEYCINDTIIPNTVVIIYPSWALWGPAMKIDVNNEEAGGFVRFRLSNRFKEGIELNVWRFL